MIQINQLSKQSALVQSFGSTMTEGTVHTGHCSNQYCMCILIKLNVSEASLEWHATQFENITETIRRNQRRFMLANRRKNQLPVGGEQCAQCRLLSSLLSALPYCCCAVLKTLSLDDRRTQSSHLEVFNSLLCRRVTSSAHKLVQKRRKERENACANFDKLPQLSSRKVQSCLSTR